MRRRHTETDSPAAAVNLTPLMDMVFILLIFFVVTSSFTKESGMEVNRPQAETVNRLEPGSIIIAIDKEGLILIDDRPTDRRAVRIHIARLQAEDPQAGVIIVADRDARTGLLVEVMDQVRLAGVNKIAIAASHRDEAP